MRADRFAPLAPDDAALLFAELSAMDEDQALSLGFFPDEARGAGLALSRFFAEVSAIPSRVSEPMMGAIRVQWWREALDEAFGGGRVRAHPLVRALAATAQAEDRPAMDAALDAAAPFLEPGDLTGAPEDAFAPFEGAAAALLGARLSADADPDRLKRMASLHALARTLAAPPPPARSHAIETPAQRVARCATDRQRSSIEERIRDPRGAGDKSLGDALPAVLPFALAEAYAKGRTPGPLAKRWTLTRAVLRGRV